MRTPIALLLVAVIGVGVFAVGTGAPATAASKQPPAVETRRPRTPSPSDSSPPMPESRLEDKDGYLLAGDAISIENYLDDLHAESGVDVRFIFARNVPGDLESFARQRARQLWVGRDVDRRGLVFVYDVSGKRMRIEVGPGLEGLFPDGFVGYLMREQTAAFFAAGNVMLGLRSTLFVVTNRVRDAALRETYDPRAVTFIANPVRLAAGGGANVRAPVGDGPGAVAINTATGNVPARFGPQPTVAAAHARYLEALRDGYFQPDLPLYAPGTDAVLRRFPITAPYAQFILFSEYGHQYTIVERGDLAILYFTTTPLVSAHMFRRTPAGWQFDIAADVRNTREYVGRAYTWEMRLSGDDYSSTFADLFADFGGLLRPKDGDNRRLPTRMPMAWRSKPPVEKARSPGRDSRPVMY